MIKGFKPHKREIREKDIDRKVREYGIEKGLEPIKLTMLGRYGKVGYPDRLWLVPGGRIFFIEMKKPGEECTERQLESHKRLRAMGFTVYVCDNAGTGKEIIDNEINRAKGRSRFQPRRAV